MTTAIAMALTMTIATVMSMATLQWQWPKATWQRQYGKGNMEHGNMKAITM